MTNRVDNANRADNASSPGTPSDGGSAWVVQSSTWGVAGNTLYCPGGGAQATMTLESSVSDVDVQGTTTTVGSDNGLVGRLTDASNHLLAAATGGVGWKLFKKVAASFTQLGSTAGGTPAINDVLLLNANASALAFKVNGTSKVTATDAFNSTATAHGLRANTDNTVRFDSFSITGLAVAARFPRKDIVKLQAISRGML